MGWKMNPEVWVTDGHWRKSLAVVRGLGRMGISSAVGESTRLATAAFSKYCRRSHVYPSPFARPGDFVDFIHRNLTRHSYRMLLPMEDVTMALVAEHRDMLSRWTYLPMVSTERLKTARRKDKVLKLAGQLGIPVPKTWYVDQIDQIESLKDELTYPVVIKPRDAAGALGVCYPETPEDFIRQYRTIHRRFPFPIVQECIPREGSGFGASFLIDERGEVKAAFMHKRIREYPVTGGASTLRESVRYDDIRDMALTLLKALDWFGVAMVEFKKDPRDGIPKLMEINPRFWGSLSLAIAAGVNFPYLLYRMAKGERFKPVVNYPTGIKCRWLLPGDLLHFIYNPDRFRLKPGFFNFKTKDTSYDILSLEDPLPVLARILTPLTFLYNGDIKKRLKMRK
jgi:predicted ATP-grasp superfamily ATP-dependent carboligase